MRARLQALVLSFFLVGLVAWADSAQARQGFYLGLGAASVSGSGLLDHPTAFMTDFQTGNVAAVGQLDNGSGATIQIGYGFNDYIALEYFGSSSHHIVNSTSPLLPSSSYDATADLGMLDFRISGKVPSGEIFVRLGLSGSGTITYKNNVYVPPLYATPHGDSQITGTTTGFGLGYERFFGKLGLQVSVNQFQMNLEKGNTGGVTFQILGSYTETFVVSDIMLSWYF